MTTSASPIQFPRTLFLYFVRLKWEKRIVACISRWPRSDLSCFFSPSKKTVAWIAYCVLSIGLPLLRGLRSVMYTKKFPNHISANTPPGRAGRCDVDSWEVWMDRRERSIYLFDASGLFCKWCTSFFFFFFFLGHVGVEGFVLIG